ncbi:3-dehydroquinate synthase [Brevibacillus centrosporus]|uniref:3-dehydroquinate synthase n=1 Tax=Brevibacillus centrosporus TaxID=54910 RepID=A0A1I4E436_9BACL|nr:3-dehydroquinate synthase [Brevibacillus centrosporus]SFK99730.1 3-dehydroquinate synthase [Brevibacillus centrosporus]
MISETLWVQLGERPYPIQIGEGLLLKLPQLLEQRGITRKSRLFFITDDNVAPLYLEQLTILMQKAGFGVSSIVISAGEQSKSLVVYEKIMVAIIEAGLDRSSVLIALGGGVVGDLTGFVAASYMRGIRFVQIPTTLVAHDSSVGGKVAINHRLGKNLIGAFYQPTQVIYDTSTLHSLPLREISAGFAEIIKSGLIADASFVEWLEMNVEPLIQLNSSYIGEAIKQGCAIKARIVSADEKEQGQRALLNLGHTFGHAFEALSNYSIINHGEAISIGICLAAKVAERLGIAESGLMSRTARLIQAYHLPTEWPSHCDPADVLEVMRRDKKALGGKITLILPRAIGQAEVMKEVDESVLQQVMQESALTSSQSNSF